MTQVFKDNSGKLSERHLSMLRLPLQLEWYNTQMQTVHVKEKKEKKTQLHCESKNKTLYSCP